LVHSSLLIPERAKKSGNPSSFHFIHSYLTEVVTSLPPTSIASDTGLTRRFSRTDKPHHQPCWRYNTEAETSIPQPPSAQTCSHRSYSNTAALSTHPIITIPHPSSAQTNSGSRKSYVIRKPMLPMMFPAGNNFFCGFTVKLGAL
jgi:hypothetical protein